MKNNHPQTVVPAQAGILRFHYNQLADSWNDGKKKGFTLVELSIVLVSVGLLIGGILVGQSMIESAKINKVVQRLTQYSVAFVNFRQKFKQEAGDTDLFPNPGDADGDTNFFQVGTCPSRVLQHLSAWSHLTQAGMLTGEKFVWPADSCVPYSPIGVMPVNKVSEAIGWEDTGYRPITSAYTGSGQTIAGKRYMRNFVTMYEAQMLRGLENKLDDGVVSTSSGSIGSYTADNLSVCTPDNVAQTIAANGADYSYCFVVIYYGETPELPL